MTITSMLDVPWLHAFWTEGPQFTALALADGAAVSSWPDEIDVAIAALGGWSIGAIPMNPVTAGHTGTFLTQATAASKPLYRASVATFNSHPAVEFDGSNDWITGTWTTATGFPFTVYAVSKITDVTVNSNNQYLWGDNPGGSGQTHFIVSTPGTGRKWGIAGDVTATSLSTTAADTTTHAHRAYAPSGFIDCFKDEVSLGTNGTGVQASSSTMKGLSLGGRSDGAVGTFASVQHAFVGVIARALTTTEISDLHSYCQSHYGTP